MTQGDPLSMPFYALSTMPLIDKLPTDGVSQVWYADDAAAVGDLGRLRRWWDSLVSMGPSYGYFPNPKKSWLVTKDDLEMEATEIFDGCGINVMLHALEDCIWGPLLELMTCIWK